MKKKVLAWALTTMTVLSLLIPGEVWAANKALRLKRTVPAAAEDNFTNRNLVGCVYLKTKGKLTKSMKFSGTVWIPEKALSSAGDSIIIEPFVSFAKKKSDFKNRDNVSGVFCKKTLLLRAGSKKKGKLVRRDPLTGKETAIGKYGTVRKSGSYYVVTIKNLPLADYLVDVTEQGFVKNKFSTKTNYYLTMEINLHSTAKKAWSGYVYMDNLKVKASKTWKTAFEKKDYDRAEGYAWDGTKVACAVKKVNN